MTMTKIIILYLKQVRWIRAFSTELLNTVSNINLTAENKKAPHEFNDLTLYHFKDFLKYQNLDFYELRHNDDSAKK